MARINYENNRVDKTWTEHIRPLVRQIIKEVGFSDEEKLKKELRTRGPQSGTYPYQVWRREIAFQLGKKKRTVALHPRLETNDGQIELFPVE